VIGEQELGADQVNLVWPQLSIVSTGEFIVLGALVQETGHAMQHYWA